MKVGDLVRCPTASDALGIIKEFHPMGDMYTVILIHNNATCFIQRQHLEKVNENR